MKQYEYMVFEYSYLSSEETMKRLNKFTRQGWCIKKFDKYYLILEKKYLALPPLETVDN